MFLMLSLFTSNYYYYAIVKSELNRKSPVVYNNTIIKREKFFNLKFDINQVQNLIKLKARNGVAI
jgi:hypothetical protein